ncbi:MAG TPA: tripartite tricarboxylate transporter substrate binding protein [Burkholderiales bacterium]|nr:tripartite tricarboxylate transporter substrate binding protein [Burkholderiales bacterium]
MTRIRSGQTPRRASNFTTAVIAVAAVICAEAATAQGAAQSYPTRPIRLVVPFNPGGGSDIVARTVAQHLASRLGQQVIVDNRPGASGNIGHAIVAKAQPDGYTLVLGSSNFVANPAILARNPYDPIKDFTPITYGATSPNVLVVHQSFSPTTFKDFLALVKANPGKHNYISPGTGTTSHLGAELLKIEAKLDLTHVPYNGAGPAVIAIVGNQVPIAFLGLPPAHPHITSKVLRPLAITSPKRYPALPDVPTIAESGFPGFDADTPQMFLVPDGTPDAIVKRLNAEMLRVLELPEVRNRFASLGFVTVGGSSEETARRIKADVAKWIRVAKLAGIKQE